MCPPLCPRASVRARVRARVRACARIGFQCVRPNLNAKEILDRGGRGGHGSRDQRLCADPPPAQQSDSLVLTRTCRRQRAQQRVRSRCGSVLGRRRVRRYLDTRHLVIAQVGASQSESQAEVGTSQQHRRRLSFEAKPACAQVGWLCIVLTRPRSCSVG
jgi:hypothetical protein